MVFLVGEEVLVQVLPLDADLLERTPTKDRSGPVDSEDLDRFIELACVCSPLRRAA